MARLDQNFEQINDSLNWWADRYLEVPSWNANSRPYYVVARIPKNTTSSAYWGTMFVASVGPLNYYSKGAWIVQVHSRSSNLTLTVTELVAPGQSVEFGYYDGGDGYWYIGYHSRPYATSGSIFLVGNHGNPARAVQLLTPSPSTTAPSGWTEVAAS